MKRKDHALLNSIFIGAIICLLTGVFGALFTTPSISTWYAMLKKPFFNPPNWIFSPVWTALYIMMGIAAALIWQKGIKQKKNINALNSFVQQLLLNVLWSVVFFGLHSPFGGLVVICLLWIAIVQTLRKFWEICPTSGYLLIPYILWVSFAVVLNASVWLLNR